MLRPDFRALMPRPGKKVWQFDMIGGDDRSRASWGNDSWKTGGGGGWMTGTYDANTDTLFWGTANPAPDYDIDHAPRRQPVHLRRRRPRSPARAS